MGNVQLVLTGMMFSFTAISIGENSNGNKQAQNHTQKSDNHLDADMSMIRIQALEWVQGRIQDLILNNVTTDWLVYNDEQMCLEKQQDKGGYPAASGLPSQSEILANQQSTMQTSAIGICIKYFKNLA